MQCRGMFFPMIWASCLLAGPRLALGGENPYSVLVVEEMLGRVTIIESDHPQTRLSVAVGFKPHEMAISPDGRSAYVSVFGLNDADNREGRAGTTIAVIDIASASARQALSLPDDLKAPHGLGFRPGRVGELYTNAEEGDRMVVFATNTGQVKQSFQLPQGIHNFVFSADGMSLYAFAPQGQVYRMNPDSGEVLARRDIGAAVRGVACMPDASRLIVSSKIGIVLVNPLDLSIDKVFPLPGAPQIFYSAATPNGRYILVPSVFAGEVTVLDSVTGGVIRQIHTGTPLRVINSPNSDVAYVANVSPAGDHLTVINLQSLTTQDITGIRDANGMACSTVLPTVFRQSANK
jgi:YVTN family beta-propeller protein